MNIIISIDFKTILWCTLSALTLMSTYYWLFYDHDDKDDHTP